MLFANRHLPKDSKLPQPAPRPIDTMEKACDLFSQIVTLMRISLKETVPAKHCLYTLIGYMTMMITEPLSRWEREDPSAIIHVTAAYDLVYSWATRPRSAEEVLRIGRSKFSCGCKRMSDAELSRGSQLQLIAYEMHTEGVNHHHEITCDTLGGSEVPPVMSLLSLALSPVTIFGNAEYSPQRVYLHSIAQRSQWPTAVEQLLPHGPEDTVRGLLAWLYLENSLMPKVYVLNTLANLVRACQPYVMPFLNTSRVLLIRGLEDSANMLWTTIHTGTTSSNKTILEALDFDIMSSLGALHHIIRECFIPCMLPIQRKRFITSYEGKILLALARLINSCDMFGRCPVDKASSASNISAAREKYQKIASFNLIFQYYASLIWTELPDSQLASIDPATRSVIRSGADTLFPTPQVLAWRMFVCAMFTLKQSERCWAPRCRRTAADAKLRYCSGCRRVTYCSRRCQKRAWMSTSCSHKNVCRSIRITCDRRRLQRDPDAMMGNIITDEKIIVPSRYSHEYSMIDEVNRHFEAMSAVEMKTLDTSCLRVASTNCAK